MRLWTEDNLPEVSRPEVGERLRNPVERSNLLRFEVLRQFGGVYVDADFECLRSIEPLLGGVEFFVGLLKPGRTANSIIGSVPAHPVLERAVAEAEARTEFGHDKNAAGSLFFDRLLKEFPEVTRFDADRFYAADRDNPEAYAVHHAARSWKTHAEINDQLKRKSFALAKQGRRLEKLERKSSLRIEKVERQRDDLAGRLAALERTPWRLLCRRAGGLAQAIGKRSEILRRSRTD